MSARDYRLPQSIRPRRYAIRIDVDLDNWRYQASEDIAVSVTEPTTAITLHAVDLDVTEARAVLADGSSLTARVSTNSEAETITLAFPQRMAPGDLTLRLRFTGTILAR